METSTLAKIKKKASRFFEPRNLQTGTVLEIRFWEPATIIEIDLHLPLADMNLWREVPYIKFRVSDLTFRDYTPMGWDAETHTCTIFVDAAHEGAGAKWAQHLRKGNTVSYFKIGTSHQSPIEISAIVALGDQSSVGHLLALQQMTTPATRFSGAVLLHYERHRKQFGEYFRSPLQPISQEDNYGHHTLIRWVLEQNYTLENVAFYLAGNETMVVQLRKLLKQQGYGNNQIKVQGFWG